MLVGRLVIQVLMSCLHDVDCKVFDDKTPVNPSQFCYIFRQYSSYYVPSIYQLFCAIVSW